MSYQGIGKYLGYGLVTLGVLWLIASAYFFVTTTEERGLGEIVKILVLTTLLIWPGKAIITISNKEIITEGDKASIFWTSTILLSIIIYFILALTVLGEYTIEQTNGGAYMVLNMVLNAVITLIICYAVVKIVKANNNS
ncbi:hypothetical protein EXS73_01520 [Candidatus Pacearchaeota archaeon]|nr:hypothetical protein [Candidatus Pacearchaeota archaeon]